MFVFNDEGVWIQTGLLWFYEQDVNRRWLDIEFYRNRRICDLGDDGCFCLLFYFG